jgi:tetratricopeptide (TPR) repeat protein
MTLRRNIATAQVACLFAASIAAASTSRDDPLRAVTFADQAAELFFETLPAGGAGLAALVGLPSPQQRELASRAARSIHELARQAEREIDAAIDTLESRPGFADDFPLQLQRRRLAEEQRDRRIPFLRGVGDFLHAHLNVDVVHEQRRLFMSAADALAPLADILQGTLADQAALYAGFAMMRLGRLDEADAMLLRIAEGDAATMFAAQIGRAMLVAQRRSMAAGVRELNALTSRYTGREGMFFRLLVADAIFQLHLNEAQRTPAHRDRLLADSFAAYTALLEPESAARSEGVREAVIAKMMVAAEHIPAETDGLEVHLPPLAMVARAERLLPSDATRPQAIYMLRRVLDDAAADARAKALALDALGRAHHLAGDALAAAESFMRLAREHATAAGAERAAELGATLAAEHYRHAPQAGGEAARTLREALDLLLSRYANVASIDRWRLLAAQLALAESRHGDALSALGDVPPGAPLWAESRFLLVRTLRAMAQQESDARRRQAAYTRLLEATTESLPVLEMAATLNEDPDAARRLAIARCCRAEAFLALGQAQQALDALPDEGDGAVLAESLPVRIAANQALGRADEAASAVDAFIEADAPSGQRIEQSLLPIMVRTERRVLNLIKMRREEQALELAERELAPIAERLDSWLAKSPDDRARRAVEPRIAEAYRLSGRCAEALQVYERLLAIQPNAAPHLLGRAECLFHIGGEERLAEAMGIYRRLIAAGPQIGETLYWQAHLRTLQILDRTQRNTHQIGPQIQRLRQIDPMLGGERFRREFDALQAKWSRG